MTYYTKDHLLESHEFPFYISPYTINPKRVMVPPHAHEFIECVYVAAGSGEHIYRNHSYPIGKGDIFIIEPNVEHAYLVKSSEPLVVYNVLFLSSLLENELRQLSQVTSFLNFFYVEPFLRKPSEFQYHLRLSVQEGIETKLLLDRILKEYKQKALGYRLSVKALLTGLFITLSRYYEQRRAQPLSVMQDEETVIRRICEFIEIHYAQPIMMEQIYQMCGMSPSTFSAKFKQYTGKTFTEFRNEVKVGVAREFLRRTPAKIIHIAHEAGFEDVSHFNKVFKLATGMTPGRYRSLVR